MAWQFGTIDFSTFGVMVSKSTGVLDFHKLKNDGYEWLDKDGKDYWQSTPKYNDREIILNCWIYAEPLRNSMGEITIKGYDNFRTKIQSFTDELKAAGKVTFVTPYINLSNCSISSGIQIVRETNYVQEQQIGTFSLRITVHGDSDYDFISILDKSSSDVKEVIKTKNLTINKTLQGEEYATCTCETNTPLTCGMYDWIRVNTDGTNLDAFLLPSTPEVQKQSTNKFVYNLRFEGITLHFKQMKFILFGESEFEFYGDLSEIAALICENVDRFIFFGNNRFTIGSCAATVKKLHNFANEDCLSALQRICGEYGMEFRFERQPDTKYKIYISEFESKANSVVLTYGKGNSLYNISRGAMDTSKLCTVLWAYGAAKNIKAGYRDGLKRLSFDGNPLKQNEATYGTWERTVNFDEIFPQRTAAVTGVLHVFPDTELPPEPPATIQYLTEAEKEVYPNGIFVIADNTLDFDLNDYLRGGLTAKIVMKTGDLAGYQFDILRYDNQYQYIHIIRFEDEIGGLLPSATLQFKPGDEYTLVDMDQPTPYVSTSEAALAVKAQEYIDQWSVPQYEYTVKTNPAYFAANPGNGFNVGDILTVTDTNLGISASHRITSMSFNYNSKIYDLTLSNFKKPTKRQQTEFRLQVIERAIFATKKETGEVIRDDKQPVGELGRTLLDPDNKLRVDNLILNGTIDGRMLGLDSNMPQIHLTDAWFEDHVGGNVDQAKQYAGQITIHNWAGINRFEVQKMKDNDEVYDPSRTWNIEETDFTSLDPTKSFNIYAKLNIAPGSTAAEIFLSEGHFDPKTEIEDGYVIYNLGNLTKDI
ncbi:MAG TPA: hypothetical protein DHV48_03625 [Prolixibacteraceae bacterium]|nr:hypothetical protein [Prolixibacteraceae bacterium]